MMKNELYVNGIDVKYKKINKDDYISLTDLARYANPEEPKIPIQTWMRNKDVIAYLGLWEKLNNENFKGHEFTTFENLAGKNSFYMSPQKWIKETDAIGIISKSGNNGGTYARSDIALEFASWLSPEFKLKSADKLITKLKIELGSDKSYIEELEYLIDKDIARNITSSSNKKILCQCPKCLNKNQKLLHWTIRLCGYIGEISQGINENSMNANQGRLSDIKNRVIHIGD